MGQRGGSRLIRALLIAAVVALGVLVIGGAYFLFSPLPVCAAAEGLPVWEGEWSRGAPMPTARSEVGAAMLDGRLYVAGGLSGPGVSDAFEVYETASDSWQSLPTLPGGSLHHVGLAAAGERIVLTGGYTDMAFSPTQAAWAFDPAADSWRRLADMPAPLGAHTSQGVEGTVYVFGGAPGGTAAWRYDLAVDAWEELAPMAEQREHLASGVVDGTIVVAGGRWGGQNRQTAAAYRIGEDDWTALPDMPTARGGIGAAVVDGRLYVAGGEEFSAQCTFDRVEVFDGVQWLRTPPMPEPRHGIAAAADGEALYIIGGATRAQAQTIASATGELLIFRPGD